MLEKGETMKNDKIIAELEADLRTLRAPLPSCAQMHLIEKAFVKARQSALAEIEKLEELIDSYEATLTVAEDNVEELKAQLAEKDKELNKPFRDANAFEAGRKSERIDSFQMLREKDAKIKKYEEGVGKLKEEIQKHDFPLIDLTPENEVKKEMNFIINEIFPDCAEQPSGEIKKAREIAKQDLINRNRPKSEYVCDNCGHPIDEFQQYGWLHINGENVERKCVEKLCRNMHKSGTKDCLCDNPMPKTEQEKEGVKYERTNH